MYDLPVRRRRHELTVYRGQPAFENDFMERFVGLLEKFVDLVVAVNNEHLATVFLDLHDEIVYFFVIDVCRVEHRVLTGTPGERRQFERDLLA